MKSSMTDTNTSLQGSEGDAIQIPKDHNLFGKIHAILGKAVEMELIF